MKQAALLGAEVRGWAGAKRSPAPVMEGRYARLERLQADVHAADLYRANSVDDAIWDHLPYGPFASSARYRRWVQQTEAAEGTVFYAIKDKVSGKYGGVASYLRINPEAGSIEVGHISFAPELQRTRAATDAMYLMMKWAFEAGYRRYEWKCNALNLGSRRAAERLGLSYEGVFRQHLVVKGRNRDTAWFAAIDSEWPALKEAFETWLRSENFDQAGQQHQRLADLTSPVRVSRDPALGGTGNT